MVSVRSRLLRGAKHIAYSLNPPIIPVSFVHKRIPYYGQWESPGLIDQIIGGSFLAKNDPNWRTSGARTRAEYAEWSWNMCGMACLKMILAHRNQDTVPVISLGKRCLKYGGYTLPFDASDGLDYRAFTEFIDKEFAITAKVAGTLLPRDIMKQLAAGNYVIASVSPLIRSPQSKPRTKGGHLILVIGYDLKRKVFMIHNPSGLAGTRDNTEISFRDFGRFFARRGIIVTGK